MRANSMNRPGPGWNAGLGHHVELIRQQHGHRGRGRGRQRGGGPDRRGAGPFAGGGAFFGPAWGPVFGPGGRGGRGRGPRVRRGDVRFAILDVIGADQVNGYQVIQEIAERTRDAWRPSPGSVYPTIAQLQDEGLVEEVPGAERKLLRLTAAGAEYVADHPDEIAAVWDGFTDEEPDPDRAHLKRVIVQTMNAVWQLAATGTPDQQERASAILVETRRRLYGVLADGPDEGAGD